MTRPGQRVVLAIENIPFERDPRARLIASSLCGAGFEVSVVCPRGSDRRLSRFVDGVPVHAFPSPPFDRIGLLGHVLEYAWCCSAIGARLVHLRLRNRADIVHICVPPHVLFIVARLLRLLGSRIVVDQHDLMPELFVARYGSSHRVIYRLVLAAERAALREADTVLTTNYSGARVAIERAGAPARRVWIVRTGPSQAEIEQVRRRSLRPIKPTLTVGYVGNIERQDGVELLIHAARNVVDALGRDDVRFVCIGSGRDLRRVQVLAQQIGVENIVEFTGALAHDKALDRLNQCDICVQPDPSNPHADSCTMIKTLEYMALGKPVVAFDLPETRLACRHAAIYATRNSPAELASKILTLARDPLLRRKLGHVGLQRIDRALAWRFGEAALLGAYRRLVQDGHQAETGGTIRRASSGAGATHTPT